MGKHERKLIEEAEKIIVDLLNNKIIDNKNFIINPWREHIIELSNFIIKEYPNILVAQHLGNRYDNTGDILLKLSSGEEIYIEIKMSATKSGIGTEANIGQDALTKNNLFIKKIKDWSEFRKEKKHDLWVDKILSLYKRYPLKIKNISNKKIKLEEKARYLRNLKLKGDHSATDILNEINKKDRDEKIEYLNYLKEQEQNPEMIKRFFILLKMGIHKNEIIKNLIDKSNFFKEIQNLFIYYANYDGNRITIRKENVGKKIQEIIKKFSDFRLIFSKSETHCKLVSLMNGEEIPLLQIAYHWKNISQGIQTPCLNIFDLTNKLIDINRK